MMQTYGHSNNTYQMQHAAKQMHEKENPDR